MASEAKRSFFARNEFLIRRLHSLSGFIPVGAYMMVHLAVNSTIVFGGWFFQEQVNKIHDLGPLLPSIEWVTIILPILFHAIVGVWIVYEANPNSSEYPLRNNIRYTLQRVTGIIAFIFLVTHFMHMHHYGAAINPIVGENIGGQFDPEHAAASASAALAPVWLKGLYAIGLLACVFHFANGIWTMGITWGVWVTPAAQAKANYLAVAIGLLLAFFGLASIYGLSNEQLVKQEKPHGSHLEGPPAPAPVAPAPPVAARETPPRELIAGEWVRPIVA